MFWLSLSVICIAYYSLVEHMAEGQQLTGVWLLLFALFLGVFLYQQYRAQYPRQKKGSLRIRTFCATTLALALIMAGVVLVRIVTGMLSAPKPGLDYIVVMSQQDMPGETGTELETRLDEAIEYLKNNPNTRVIVSGGWNVERGASHAHTMYQYLQRQGIETGRILWEIRSETTEQNLEYAAAITGDINSSVGIVASDYNMYRTMRIARSTGLHHTTAVPASTTPWLYPHRLVVELLYVVRDKFLGI